MEKIGKYLLNNLFFEKELKQLNKIMAHEEMSSHCCLKEGKVGNNKIHIHRYKQEGKVGKNKKQIGIRKE